MRNSGLELMFLWDRDAGMGALVGDGCACVTHGGGEKFLNPEKEHINSMCSIDKALLLPAL